MREAEFAHPEIRKLDALLVNQIAAGEVVDRPASVVKELVDNAIDAGATRIEVELERGGIELIRVTDNGCGIGAEQMRLAVEPHATSKVRQARDLDRIATMGFRGEALASIMSVARMHIRSRRADEAGACEISAEGDTVGEVRPGAGAVGTSVTVRNLFFNTPARRKFLRTPPTEQGHCVAIVRELAMAHPAIGFVVSCDGKVTIDVPADQGVRDRVLALIGEELGEQMVAVEADHLDDERGVMLWGLAGLPVLARATAKSQHVFLNGRPIRDKTVQHAIREAYRGLIEPGRYPTIALMIEMSPAAVDVNVHPAKTEVRFRDSSLVHGVVLRSVREALMRADLTPSAGEVRGLSGGRGYGGGVLPSGGNTSGGSGGRIGVEAEEFVEWFKDLKPGVGEGGQRFDFAAVKKAIEGGGIDAASLAVGASEGEAFSGEKDDPGRGRVAEGGGGGLVRMSGSGAALQVHRSYVVTEDEEGMVVVDQHALHERVMFEKLLERVVSKGEGLEKQRLLMPAVVEIGQSQMELVEAFSQEGGLFAKLGVEVSEMGPTSVAVQAFPTFLFDKGVEPEEFVRELLDRAEEEGFSPGDEQTLHEVLDMMSCKAAIKAGNKLSDVELAELLAMRERVERSSNCPHGRPTSVRITIGQLEKMFNRA